MKSRQLVRKGGMLIIRIIIRQSTNLLLRYLLKFLLFALWTLPTGLYGWWVVLGFYMLAFEAFEVWLDFLDPLEVWWHVPVWLYLARWRWNWKQLHRGIRPLYERRDDL